LSCFLQELIDMKSLSADIGKALRSRKKKLAIAESCTGGYLSHLITSVSGSSDYFMGGIIAYDNQIKIKELGVRTYTLKKYGAVSAECAGEMAIGITKRMKTDLALAVTGIAGPTGGVKGKPVGTVYIAFVAKNELLVERFSFKGNRKRVIEQSAHKALEMLEAGILRNGA